jgi:hypothetical protein
MFRDNVSVPSSWVKKSDISPKKWVKDYHSSLRNNPEECRAHQHCGGRLKSFLPILYQLANTHFALGHQLTCFCPPVARVNGKYEVGNS